MDPPEIVALGEKYPGLKKVFETGVEVNFDLSELLRDKSHRKHR